MLNAGAAGLNAFQAQEPTEDQAAALGPPIGPASDGGSSAAVMAASVNAGAPEGEAPSGTAETQKYKPAERDLEAIKHLRAVHTRYDRARRKWQATVAESLRNDRTVGSKVETELAEMITEADLQDEIVVELERKFLQKTPFLDADLEKGTKATNALKDFVKKGNQKQGALKVLFSLK